MITQTLNLNDIAFNQGILAQQDIYLLGIWRVNEIGGFLSWHIFQAPHLLISYVIFFIATLAECNRAPFDIPEAESELIGGFHTEYGGIRFAFIFLAEYAMMFLVAMLGVVIFLGAGIRLYQILGAYDLPTGQPDWAGGILDPAEILDHCRNTDMDPLDPASIPSRPADDLMLENINPPRLRMHGDIGTMENINIGLRHCASKNNHTRLIDGIKGANAYH